MISLNTVIGILFLHWLADFVLQTDWMASNKSKNFRALTAHTFVYSFCFLLFFGLEFALATFALHTATDAITSRITHKLWNINALHWFFVVIGFDQFLHFATLLLTYVYLR